MSAATLHTRAAGPATVLTLDGKVRAQDLPGLKSTVERAAAMPGGCLIVLDCSALRSIDSTAIGFLISSFKAVCAGGRDFAIANLGPEALEALRVTGLSAILPIHDTLDAALGAGRS
ncbi:MAG: STAS domain-containing protein [Candidatus Sumerlaeia bacterium]|nr:STAS domain-containing protein [Candidatus Sumerlaeia bacterium]